MSEIMFYPLSHHFISRFNKNLLILQITNNQAVANQICSFLNVKDVLSLSACSSQFRKFVKMQTIQLRIIKKKLQFYEKPKVTNQLDPLLQYFSNRIPEDIYRIKRGQQLFKDHQSAFEFRKLVHFFNYLKTPITFENKKEDIRKKEQLKPNHVQIASNRQQIQLMPFRQLPLDKQNWSRYKKSENNINSVYPKDNRRMDKDTHPVGKSNSRQRSGKKMRQYNPSIAQLSNIEYLHAKRDYQKRKKIRLQLKRKVDLSLKIMESNYTKQFQSPQAISRQNQKNIIKFVNLLKHSDNLKQSPATHPALIGLEQSKNIIIAKPSITQKVYWKIKNFLMME